MASTTFESVLSQARALTPSERARLIGMLAQDLAQPTVTNEQRRVLVRAVRGKYAHVKTSVDDFLARKREEVELEERRYEERHRGEQKP
jgi:hypothetical protein